MPLTTPLTELHRRLGAKFVDFAGYDMPVQFPPGILAEQRHTRAHASLFDVSHMGQIRLDGTDAAGMLEGLVPGAIRDLAVGQSRYTMFTLDSGGILDDITVTRHDDHLALIVNASRKAVDTDHLRTRFGQRLTRRDDQALLALQGPAAANVLERLAPGIGMLGFMRVTTVTVADATCVVTRSGYTGEDGFEISLPAHAAEQVARLLLDQPEAMPAGLGARDGLRLEAGLCLYGHDIDETTSPVEADLAWSIQKRRRAEGGFPGAGIIVQQLRDGVARRRVGIMPRDRVIARDGTTIVDSAGNTIGNITSGGFSPTLGKPIAMGYVTSSVAYPGTEIGLVVRGTVHAADIVSLPFVPHRYYRGANVSPSRGSA